jgi:hypothetical protein
MSPSIAAIIVLGLLILVIRFLDGGRIDFGSDDNVSHPPSKIDSGETINSPHPKLPKWDDLD